MRKIKSLLNCFLIVLLLISCTSKSNETTQIRLWHTELDSDASDLINLVASSVEETFLNRGRKVDIQVTKMNWGDLSTRIIQEEDNLPDITHLQPFMVKEFLLRLRSSSRYDLIGLDSVLSVIEIQNNDKILPSLRNIHRYGNPLNQESDTYGIAYAAGTTLIAYRTDWVPEGTVLPNSWDQLPRFSKLLAEKAKDLGYDDVQALALPGRSPFFIDQLFNEIVVSNGGSLYENSEPNLDNVEVRKTLEIFQEMIALTGGSYFNTDYQLQFTLLAQDKVAVVPVTYGRASKRIENELISQGSNQLEADRRRFGILPHLSSIDNPVATIDAEPWILIEDSEDGISSARQLKKNVMFAFLEEFYSRENYEKFTRTVPIHLRPIFEGMADEYLSDPSQIEWSHWGDVSTQMLGTVGKTAPIMMDADLSSTTQPAFILSLQSRNIISDMVNDTIGEPVLSTISQGRTVPSDLQEKILDDAILRAVERSLAAYSDSPRE